MDKSLENKGDGKSNISPIKVENLRKHFKKTYKLVDDQIEVMIESSARSLRATFLAAENTLGDQESYDDIARHAHSMKGLLLNMGEAEWAARAREIELAALEKKNIDYRRRMAEIRSGVREII